MHVSYERLSRTGQARRLYSGLEGGTPLLKFGSYVYIWPSILSKLKTYIYDIGGGNVLSVNLFERSPGWGTCVVPVYKRQTQHTLHITARTHTYTCSPLQLWLASSRFALFVMDKKVRFCPSLQKSSMLSKNFGFAPPCKSLAFILEENPKRGAKFRFCPSLQKSRMLSIAHVIPGSYLSFVCIKCGPCYYLSLFMY